MKFWFGNWMLLITVGNDVWIQHVLLFTKNDPRWWYTWSKGKAAKRAVERIQMCHCRENHQTGNVPRIVMVDIFQTEQFIASFDGTWIPQCYLDFLSTFSVFLFFDDKSHFCCWLEKNIGWSEYGNIAGICLVLLIRMFGYYLSVTRGNDVQQNPWHVI